MFDLSYLSLFALLGAFVGFVAGLLGVGGGGIMVPVMTSLFLWKGNGDDKAVHLALGTSMASIVVTSISSMMAHHRRGGVNWQVVRAMVPGIILGTYVATFFVSLLNAIFLASFFSIFMFFVAIQMIFGAKPNPSRALPHRSILVATGAGIGGISALVSIGGGSLSVPFLYWHNIPLKKAVGTSAAIGFPIALSGTIGYLINGPDGSASPEGVLGFIYIPGVVAVSVVSAITAPLGVKLAHNIPVDLIKKIFSILLIGLSIKMLFAVVL